MPWIRSIIHQLIESSGSVEVHPCGPTARLGSTGCPGAVAPAPAAPATPAAPTAPAAPPLRPTVASEHAFGTPAGLALLVASRTHALHGAPRLRRSAGTETSTSVQEFHVSDSMSAAGMG